MQRVEILIIGAGPAGLSCAIQLKRSGKEAIVLEAHEIGGLVRNANLIENLLGFPRGITGLEIARLFKEHVRLNDVRIRTEAVLSLDYDGDSFEVRTNRDEYKAERVVVATGTKPVEINMRLLDTGVKDRVFYEPLSLMDMQDKDIAIIGSGDCAFDYAVSLSVHNNIFILMRGERHKCLPVLFERCSRIERIELREGFDIKRVEVVDDRLLITSEGDEIEADYLVPAIGRVANLGFMGNRITSNLQSLIKDKRLFFIGDVRNERFRQVAISMGDGIRVAMEIYAQD